MDRLWDHNLTVLVYSTEFNQAFNSDEIKAKTYNEFQTNRQWGVTGYPTVLFKNQEELFKINYGYSEFSAMKEAIDIIVGDKSKHLAIK